MKRHSGKDFIFRVGDIIRSREDGRLYKVVSEFKIDKFATRSLLMIEDINGELGISLISKWEEKNFDRIKLQEQKEKGILDNIITWFKKVIRV
jgi:hypothetical protein